MNYRVIVSDQARRDLDGIFSYIANNLHSVRNAAAQLKRLEDVILSLDIMPERYRRYDRGLWKGRNLRVVSVDHYLVFYVPDEKSQTVTITRVLYGRQDVARQFFE